MTVKRQVITRDAGQRRYLLDPVVTEPLGSEKMYIYPNPKLVPKALLDKVLNCHLVALDFETKGNDFSHPDFRAVGVSVSDGETAIYVSLESCLPNEKKRFLRKLAEKPLIGHNVMFDGGVFKRELGLHANWRFCTYGLFKQLSSESNDLRWGLKHAQKELLGWKETNETDLDQWLVNNGYHNDTPFKTELKAIKDPDTKEIVGWEHPASRRYLKKGTDRWFTAEKGEMWRAPTHILGKYCNLDAYSTWLLFSKVLNPALEKVDRTALQKYHRQDFLTEIEILIDQQLSGVTIDRDRLETYHVKLKEEIDQAKSSFLSHPDILPILQEYAELQLKILEDRRPVSKYKKPPKLSSEPNRITKSGDVSRNWIKWNDRRKKIEGWNQDPDNIRADWIKWEEKYTALKSVCESLLRGELNDGETEVFNINSAEHLKWLLYDRLGYEPILTTKAGQPAVSGEAIQQMGPELKDLLIYKDKTKELGYVEACLERLRKGSDGLWRLHLQSHAPGTLTGRLAGTGGLNYQQLPKSAGYLSCWRPMKPDKIYLDCDWTALEPTVITELTRDPGMMKVYGPEAKNQDIYLYFGASIPGIGEEIRAAGFNPDNPTAEGKANAKKICKKIRSICKTVVLAKQYGAGAPKIFQTLQLNKVDVTLEEVEKISESYNETFKGLQDFYWQLKREWKANGGYVYNGIGRPMTVAEDYLKDLTNRVVQSTGHDIHMKALRIFKQIMLRERIKFSWIIADFHDQFLIECEKKDAKRIKDLINGEVCDTLNRELGGLIPIKGDPQIVNCLAEAKLEDYAEEEETS